MKHIKPFLESKDIFTEISDEDFKKKTCRSIGGEKYDEYGVFKKEELFSINDIRILDKVLEKNKGRSTLGEVDEYKYVKYKPSIMGKYDKSVRPEYQDYYYIKMLYFGIEYLITKKEDDWFYVQYSYDRTEKFWECDQIEGVLSLLQELKVIR